MSLMLPEIIEIRKIVSETPVGYLTSVQTRFKLGHQYKDIQYYVLV